MCGISAAVVLPPAKANLYNKDNSSAGYTNGYVNSNTSGQANGHANGDANGHANGHTNGYTNGHTDSHTNGLVDAPAKGQKGEQTDLAVKAPTPALGQTHDALAKQLQASIDDIKHRGPDGSGVWVSSDASVGLAHCRLSINDLSPSGSQPLTSDDGQVHAVVNGEIYDFDRLRQVCATEYGYKFGGTSDSELVLALYKIFGSPGMFEHLRGEFAFVLYDSRPSSRRVVVGRDRFGIKPLVWTVVGNRVLLAAEAKAFKALDWEPEFSIPGIVDSGWMLDDRTVFKGVRKLMPGHWMEITDERGIEIRKYWDAEYEHKVCEPFCPRQ